MTNSAIAILLPAATPAQSRAVLGAMLAVAEAGGAASDADRRALEGADRFLFGHPGPFDFGALKPVSPEALKAALEGAALGKEAIKFLTVMALVDGEMDRIRGEVGAERFASGRFAEARGIFESLSTSNELVEFLTLPAYERLA